MILRTLYAIKQTLHFKDQLKHYTKDLGLQIKIVREITPEYLQTCGVNALVLDFDGVLAAHGEHVPRPEIIIWLQELSHVYAPHKIYILSNKPIPTRIEFFRRNFPEIVFIKAKRKKPYPDGLQEIIEHSGLDGRQVMLIDDRLTTGVLAALIAGVQVRWVTKPYINIKGKTLSELWFIFLRWFERLLVAV